METDGRIQVSERPNILLIFTDQHRLSGVGCYGETVCRTPNIDRLAAQGVRFETAYTTCPVCSPARGTVMTGLFPHAHGICSNAHNLGSAVHELADRPELLSRRLQAAGYQCGYSGKWHLGSNSTRAFGGPNEPSLPKDVGFEGQNFPGHGGGGFNYPEYRAYLEENGFVHEVYQVREDRERVWPYGVLRGEVESTVPYFLTENSMGLIDRFAEEGAPFFMWHNFWGPHGPFYVPREFYDMYADVEIPEWPNHRWEGSKENAPYQVKRHPRTDELEWADWAEAVRHYYAFATLIDRQIGRLLGHLEETGLAENTVVIFTADHGQTLGSHGGLTDKGWHHFEEIQRVPMIARVPGCEEGVVRQEWVSLADLYPTILELAGGECGEGHGRSFAPLLRGEEVAWREAVFVEFHGVNNLATTMISARQGDIKYGWNCSNRDELYDLATDPHETVNLVDDPEYARALATMRQLLADWMRDTGHPGLGMYEFSRLGIHRIP